MPYILGRRLADTAVFGVQGSVWRRRRRFPHPAGLAILVLSVPWCCPSCTGTLCLTRSAHAIGKRLTPITCTLARCTLATGSLLTSSSYQHLLTLHMPLVTLPTAASVFQLAAAKNVGSWRSSGCKLLGRWTSSLMLPWFTTFMAVLLNLLVMVSLATPTKCSSIRP